MLEPEGMKIGDVPEIPPPVRSRVSRFAMRLSVELTGWRRRAGITVVRKDIVPLSWRSSGGQDEEVELRMLTFFHNVLKIP
jgi:hypothetical protein